MSHSTEARLPVLHPKLPLTASSRESNVSISFNYDIHVGHREMGKAGQSTKRTLPNILVMQIKKQLIR